MVDGTANDELYPINFNRTTWNSLRGTQGSSASPVSTSPLGRLNAARRADNDELMNGFDLPTETMWEIAARAGETTKWAGGDTTANLSKYAWWRTKQGAGNSDNIVHNVGMLAPNAWGIYDTSGNMAEGCRDVWVDELAKAQTDAFNVIASGDDAASFGVRGGSYLGWVDDETKRIRLSARIKHAKSSGTSNFGWRLAYYK